MFKLYLCLCFTILSISTAAQQSYSDIQQHVAELCVKLQNDLSAAMKTLPPIVSKDIVHWQRRERIKSASDVATKLNVDILNVKSLLAEMEKEAKVSNNAAMADEAMRAANFLSHAQGKIQLIVSSLALVNRFEDYTQEQIASLGTNGKSYYSSAAAHVQSAYNLVSVKVAAAKPSPISKPQYASAEETRLAVDLETSRLLVISYCMKQMRNAIDNPILTNALIAIPDESKVRKQIELLRTDLKAHYFDMDTALLELSNGIAASEQLKQPTLLANYKNLEEDLKMIRRNLDAVMKLLPSKTSLEAMTSEQLLLLIYSIKVPFDKSQDLVFEMSKKFPKSYQPSK